jgi:signal transduction histidine kinase
VPGLRSLRNRLALLFGLIVLGAILLIYMAVVPQLEGALRQQKVDSLAEEAAGPAAQAQRRVDESVRDQRIVQVAADRTGVRVMMFDTSSGTQGANALTLAADSAPDAEAGADEVVPVAAQEAALTGRRAQGTEPTERGRIATVAVPLRVERQVAKVLVFSDDLEDVAENVAFIRGRLVFFGALALLIAIAAGYLVARGVSARARRLETVARKVAAGDFSSRIEVERDDELGRLAEAFDDMQHQLARLHDARAQFIATASHELRTPIFSLGGFLELLADEDLDEETRKQFIEQVRGQVDRLGKLTLELLDLSRLDAGALELRPETTDLGALAREVAAEFTPTIQRHDASVSVEDAADGIEVECDPERVAQVLRILMDNALVHTPPGTAITLTADRVNGEARVTVADTGLGIKRQTMPHIFEPFFTSNDDAQGAGLGLTIASELAERMSGRLEARSTPGATAFTLVLPA